MGTETMATADGIEMLPLPGDAEPRQPVVGRWTAPDRRTTVVLRPSVWREGKMWSCLERTYRAGGGFIAPHRHDLTEEVHIIRSGEARYLLGAKLRRASAGSVIRVPAGVPHSDPWATRSGEMTVLTLLSPGGRELLDFGLGLAEMTARGNLDRFGQPPLPTLMRLVHDAGADVHAAGLPTALQKKVTTPALAALGRRLEQRVNR